MIGKSVISKQAFYEYIKKTFINYDDNINLLCILNQVEDYNLTEKLFYLLYNDYIPFNQFFNDLYDSDLNENLNNINQINSKIQELINSDKYKDIFNTPYGHMKKYFIRDILITLSFADYYDNININQQLELIYFSFTDEEKNILKELYTNYNYLDLSSSIVNQHEEYKYILPLIRIKKKIDYTCHAAIEVSNNINNISKYINENFNVFQSIFKKISFGTIH